MTILSYKKLTKILKNFQKDASNFVVQHNQFYKTEGAAIDVYSYSNADVDEAPTDIQVYCNDSFGNYSSSNVSFFVNIPKYEAIGEWGVVEDVSDVQSKTVIVDPV